MVTQESDPFEVEECSITTFAIIFFYNVFKKENKKLGETNLLSVEDEKSLKSVRHFLWWIAIILTIITETQLKHV